MLVNQNRSRARDHLQESCLAYSYSRRAPIQIPEPSWLNDLHRLRLLFLLLEWRIEQVYQRCTLWCITPSATIDGGQAEYIRVPHAASSLVKAPSSMPEDMLVLMADVFPTGYFAASRFLKDVPQIQKEDITAVVLGCGPVGTCAIASAIYLTCGQAKIFAVDSIPERLAAAEKLGAIPIALSDDPITKIKAASHGRGAAVAMEVVGHVDVLQLAFELIRRFGKTSSVGVHKEQISFPGFALYSKNVTMSFGRCPMRSLFDEALTVYEVLEERLRFLCQVKMPLEQAPEAFRLFEKQKLHKILFSV